VASRYLELDKRVGDAGVVVAAAAAATGKILKSRLKAMAESL
jgi:hypothetical protein